MVIQAIVCLQGFKTSQGKNFTQAHIWLGPRIIAVDASCLTA